MANFEYGTHCKVIASGRIGMVIDSTRARATLNFYDKNYFDPDQETFKKTDIEIVNDRSVKASCLKQFIKGKLSFAELTEGSNLLPDLVDNDPKAYKITLKDILSGILVYEDKPFMEICEWVETILAYEDQISFVDDPWEMIRDKVTDQDIMNLLWRDLDEFRWTYDYYDNQANEVLKDIKNNLIIWLESKRTQLPPKVLRTVAEQFDDDTIDKESAATQKLFKKCLDAMCEKKDPKSIQRRGYCYYCGTKIYPNDWIKARDAFLEYYQLTGDASAANTLGYIFYYGRCNNGVPEYEEAFKYFSIGHAFTYFESTYKLADMFAHGYGVVKDGKTANHLYWSVYTQNLERFIREDYECKFADAALRMGNCFRYGYGAEVDLRTAYYYYLQADLAIRKRTEVANHYGDTVVFNGVQRALEEVRQEYTEKGRTEYYVNPIWLNWTLIKHRRCKMKIRELKEGALQLTASPMKRRDENKAPLMLIAIPKADYCELKDKIMVRTAPNSTYSVVGDGTEFVFDSYQYDWNGGTKFYLGDDLVAEIITERYAFKAPSKKEQAPEGKIYHFVRVVFEGSGRAYDYLCDDSSVKAGDQVIINGYDGEKAVNVVLVFDKYENQLGLPIERYKKVIRKV